MFYINRHLAGSKISKRAKTSAWLSSITTGDRSSGKKPDSLYESMLEDLEGASVQIFSFDKSRRDQVLLSIMSPKRRRSTLKFPTQDFAQFAQHVDIFTIYPNLSQFSYTQKDKILKAQHLVYQSTDLPTVGKQLLCPLLFLRDLSFISQ